MGKLIQMPDCSLCGLSRKENDKVYRAYQNGRMKDAASSASKLLLIDVTEKEVREHLRYHNFVQPPVRRPLDPDAALTQAMKFNGRNRAILRTLYRTGGLTIGQAGKLFWPNADSESRECSTRMWQLSRKNFIYEFRPTAEGRCPPSNSLIFAGREAVPFLERSEGKRINEKNWIANVREVKQSHIDHITTTHDVPIALAAQIRELSKSEKTMSFQGASFNWKFSPLNWYGWKWLQHSFVDSMTNISHRFSPDGFAALGIEFAEQNISLLCPFFYEVDNGGQLLDSFVQKLLKYAYVTRSPLIGELFPQLAKFDVPIPTIIVTTDARRAARIQESFAAELSKHPLDALVHPPGLFITDAATFGTHGLTGDVWRSIWPGRIAKLSLAHVLLAAASKNKPQIVSNGILVCSA